MKKGFLISKQLFAFVFLISLCQSFPHCINDPSSHTNCDEITTTNLILNFTVDFDQQIFNGSITLNMTVLKDNVTQVVLDNQGIEVYYVQQLVAEKWENLTFTQNTNIGVLGNALSIDLHATAKTGDQPDIRVFYATTSEALAISWLNVEQTASKTLKYLYTQCESIYCRSVAPLQDTPSIKSTYEAFITVKSPYVVKMSAVELANTTNNDSTITYHFEQNIKVASYLIAIAVGNISEFKLGERTYVVSEPNVLQKYADQLVDLELALNASEEYMTEYIWGVYKILVLPPSFPYGGMENPLLTFASPSIVIGDKLQVVAVPTHEIAHSWTGNEVTCKDWSNIWLNEGFTVFIERKVNEKRYDSDFVKIEAQLGNTSMWQDNMIPLGLNNSYNSLLPNLSMGQNPDEALTGVPYEKGYQFLAYLETVFNSKEDFQDILRTYVKTYSQQSVTYLDFKSHIEQWINSNYSAADQEKVLSKIDWTAWVLTPGDNPPYAGLNFTTESAQQFDDLADAYILLGGDSSPSNYEDYKNAKNSILKVLFLNRLQSKTQNVTYKLLYRIDQDLNISNDESPEIGQRWFPLAIEHQYYERTLDNIDKYLGEQGRIKYVNPVYSALVKFGRRDLAYQYFIKHQDFYHPITRAGVRKIILSTVDNVDHLVRQIEREHKYKKGVIY